MRSVLILSAAALSLAGCAVVPVQPAPAPVAPPVVVAPTPTAPSTVGSATRAAAVSVVNREMAARLPGVNVMPYTSCVVNNATQAELADLASSGASGGAAGAVASIVKRPAASSCIAALSRTA
ncbi:hypothetical protein DRW48_09405 [Paracoccus suum]|uniref:Succinate dehydrogenase n=1 Tax=Paracoccus suum TaxID=2259340 RepID=A0A344PKH2_9RHOB|nr:hypothetical protein [Paracoccus suum]AXC49877.1 hypothetical protein DRW48_09405 [Paracoccus suum]